MIGLERRRDEVNLNVKATTETKQPLTYRQTAPAHLKNPRVCGSDSSDAREHVIVAKRRKLGRKILEKGELRELYSLAHFSKKKMSMLTVHYFTPQI